MKNTVQKAATGLLCPCGLMGDFGRCPKCYSDLLQAKDDLVRENNELREQLKRLQAIRDDFLGCSERS